MYKTLQKLRSLVHEMWRQYLLQFKLSNSFTDLFDYFFVTWCSIHQFGTLLTDDNDIQSKSIKRRNQILAIKIFLTMTLLRTAQFALLTFIPLDTHWRVILWDQMLFQGTESYLNFAYVLYGIFGSYVYWRMYFLGPAPAAEIRGTVFLMAQWVRTDPVLNREPVMLRVERHETRKYFIRICNKISWAIFFWGKTI